MDSADLSESVAPILVVNENASAVLPLGAPLSLIVTNPSHYI